MQNRVLRFVSLVIVSFSGGCQVDLSSSLGSRLFYPDNLGNVKVGDPRKPMYEGSGYHERHSSGSDSDKEGFPGMNPEGGAK